MDTLKELRDLLVVILVVAGAVALLLTGQGSYTSRDPEGEREREYRQGQEQQERRDARHEQVSNERREWGWSR